METSEDFFDMRNAVKRSIIESKVISGQDQHVAIHGQSTVTGHGHVTNLLTFKNLGYLLFGQNTVFEGPY